MNFAPTLSPQEIEALVARMVRERLAQELALVSAPLVARIEQLEAGLRAARPRRELAQD